MTTKDEKPCSPDVLFNQSINIFYTVCQCRNFTVAARTLGITQSAVSQCIAGLEKTLGFDLFDRSTRPMNLTRDAQLFRDSIQEQRLKISNVIDSIRTQNFIQTSVSVGVIESIGHCIGSDIITGMLNYGRRIELRCGTSDFLYQELLKDKLDCIVVTGKHFDAQNLDSTLLLSEPHVVILPKSIAAKHQDWSWMDLSLCGIPMVRYANNTSSGEHGEKTLSQVNMTLPNRFSVENNDVVFALVVDGFGWCLTQPLTALLAQNSLDKISVIPAPHPCESRRIFVVRKKDTPRIYVDEILKICQKALRSKALPKISTMMPWVSDQITVSDSF